MIIKLPHWVMTDDHPAFYDTESSSAIKMVAKLYYKMQELIEDYNKTVDNINDLIDLFTSSSNAEIEDFKAGIRQEFQDFIDIVELKLNTQDKEIEDAVKFMKDNLSYSITKLVLEMKANGEFNEAIMNALSEVLAVQVKYINEEQLYITNAVKDITAYNEENNELIIITPDSLNGSSNIDISGKEDKINKVQEISETSSDIQYPSAKSVYEYVNEKVSNEIDVALGGEY